MRFEFYQGAVQWATLSLLARLLHPPFFCSFLYHTAAWSNVTVTQFRRIHYSCLESGARRRGKKKKRLLHCAAAEARSRDCPAATGLSSPQMYFSFHKTSHSNILQAISRRTLQWNLSVEPRTFPCPHTRSWVGNVFFKLNETSFTDSGLGIHSWQGSNRSLQLSAAPIYEFKKVSAHFLQLFCTG